MERLSEGVFIRRHTTHHALHEALRSLPIDPISGSLTFSAFDLDMPAHNDPVGQHKYVEECKTKGVMPHTTQEFRFRSDKGLYIPSNPESLATIYSDSEDPTRNATIDGLIRGGKTHRIRIGLKEYYGNEVGFHYLVDALIPRMVEEDYRITSGEFTLSSYHLTGYNWGDYVDASIIFFVDPRGAFMSLNMGHKLTGEQQMALLEWHSRLKEIHEGGQVSMLP